MTTTTLHPIFEAICSSFREAPGIVARCEYETALRQFDWQFEFADDSAVYRRGAEALKRLREQQQRIDPAGRVWLSIAPHAHGVPQPVVRSAS